jgi:hypothetical protein
MIQKGIHVHGPFDFVGELAYCWFVQLISIIVDLVLI